MIENISVIHCMCMLRSPASYLSTSSWIYAKYDITEAGNTASNIFIFLNSYIFIQISPKYHSVTGLSNATPYSGWNFHK